MCLKKYVWICCLYLLIKLEDKCEEYLNNEEFLKSWLKYVFVVDYFKGSDWVYFINWCICYF